MPLASNWRSIARYQYLTRLDRSGFAWEFLRRNTAYQEDYNIVVRETGSDADSEARSTERLSRRWGLWLRNRPATDRRRGERILASGCSAHDHFARSNELRGCAPTRNRRTWRRDCRTGRRRRTPRHRSIGQRRSASFVGRPGRPAAIRCPAS
ncbi:MAG TPA: DUF6499 domain-containing protein [Xanthobacteraceae bacterium]